MGWASAVWLFRPRRRRSGFASPKGSSAAGPLFFPGGLFAALLALPARTNLWLDGENRPSRSGRAGLDFDAFVANGFIPAREAASSGSRRRHPQTYMVFDLLIGRSFFSKNKGRSLAASRSPPRRHGASSNSRGPTSTPRPAIESAARRPGFHKKTLNSAQRNASCSRPPALISPRRKKVDARRRSQCGWDGRGSAKRLKLRNTCPASGRGWSRSKTYSHRGTAWFWAAFVGPEGAKSSIRRKPADFQGKFLRLQDSRKRPTRRKWVHCCLGLYNKNGETGPTSAFQRQLHTVKSAGS